jgi:hypothetical protein
MVSSGRIPHRVLFAEILKEEPPPPPGGPARPEVEESDEEPSNFVLNVYGASAERVRESWLSRLFLNFNEVSIFTGALAGALLRMLIYFRTRHNERPSP